MGRPVVGGIAYHGRKCGRRSLSFGLAEPPFICPVSEAPEDKCDERQQHHPSIQENFVSFIPHINNRSEAFAMQFWH
jgi:hypothetical protein